MGNITLYELYHMIRDNEYVIDKRIKRFGDYWVQVGTLPALIWARIRKLTKGELRDYVLSELVRLDNIKFGR